MQYDFACATHAMLCGRHGNIKRLSEAGKPGEGGRRVCVFYNRRHGCFKGDHCPDLHIKTSPNSTGLQHDLGAVVVYDEDQSNLLPREGTLVVVTISTVITPTKFYVTLPWGRLTALDVLDQSDAWRRFQAEESLEGLMDNMQDFYGQRQYDRDLTVLGFCEAIAARVDGRWIRAKVVDSDEDKGLIQVVSVDFGWETWVKETDLRDLELRFLHLPPQAVACSLATVAPPIHHGHRWVPDACKYFADSVLEKTLVAYVKEKDPSGRLSLVLHDTSRSEDISINQAMVDAGWARTVSADQSSWFPDQNISTSPSSGRASELISLAPA
ncbi:tudor domain-containing protein 1-like [Elysia marginata]|uniref:Tudor domain-containing protein 1-like n=1 Tax=Elysia marginata TaxID=1093978 RepID=A0AAV4JRI6_9GAST|nr:tudor domain-containing protein 1-like [Elysia marginata]